MSTFSPESLLFMKLQEAERLCRAMGRPLRVVMEDGEACGATCDVVLDRINVGVDNGIVTSIRGFG